MSKDMKQNKIAARLAEARDRDVLVEFNCRMALETEQKRLVPDLVRSGVERILADREMGFYVVAEKECCVVGALMVTTEWSDWRNAEFWWIQSVFVRTEHRRAGVFKTLYDFVSRLANDDSEVCGLRLYVERDNSSAQNTYLQMGLRPTAYLLFEKMKSDIHYLKDE